MFGVDFNEGAIEGSGIVGSIVGAVLVLLAYRSMNRAGASHRA